jgi:hypothetical protein
MKTKLILAFLLFFSSCGKPIVDKSDEVQREVYSSEYDLKREVLNYNFTRYSNKEITCYTFNGFDLDCKWKF